MKAVCELEQFIEKQSAIEAKRLFIKPLLYSATFFIVSHIIVITMGAFSPVGYFLGASLYVVWMFNLYLYMLRKSKAILIESFSELFGDIDKNSTIIVIKDEQQEDFEK